VTGSKGHNNTLLRKQISPFLALRRGKRPRASEEGSGFVKTSSKFPMLKAAAISSKRTNRKGDQRKVKLASRVIPPGLNLRACFRGSRKLISTK